MQLRAQDLDAECKTSDSYVFAYAQNGNDRVAPRRSVMTVADMFIPASFQPYRLAIFTRAMPGRTAAAVLSVLLFTFTAQLPRSRRAERSSP